MVARDGYESGIQHQCLTNYLHFLVFTKSEFTVNTNKCSTLCALIMMLVLNVISTHLHMPHYQYLICL